MGRKYNKPKTASRASAAPPTLADVTIPDTESKRPSTPRTFEKFKKGYEGFYELFQSFNKDRPRRILLQNLKRVVLELEPLDDLHKLMGPRASIDDGSALSLTPRTALIERRDEISSALVRGGLRLQDIEELCTQWLKEKSKTDLRGLPGAVPELAEAQREAAKRLKGTIGNQIAVRRMESYLESKGLGLTEFAIQIGTTDRTLRSFRRTGRVRRDIFNAITTAMSITNEELLKP